MFAIYAFRRDLTHRTNPALSTQEVMFELRSYGCFNGANDPMAFTRMQNQNGTATEDTAVILMPRSANANNDVGRMRAYATTNGQPNPYWSSTDPQRLTQRRAFALSKAEHRNQYNQAITEYTPGEWACIGFGYMAYKVAETIGGNQLHMPVPYSTPGIVYADPLIGVALQHEGFAETYYDGYNGGDLRTRRRLTPNEKFLSDLFVPYQQQRPTLYVDNELATWSRMLCAAANNRNFHGSLYQFVGTERSSGSAVAYLQMFRNVAEFQTQGWSGAKTGLVNHLTRTILPGLRPEESRVAILDYFTHHGDDSAIISFASNQFIAHVTKYGYWESSFLFRDTRPMLIEGRYNKGGQSAEIRSNITRALQARSSQERINAGASLDGLSSYATNALQAYDIHNFTTTQAMTQEMRSVLGMRPVPPVEQRPQLAFERLTARIRDLVLAFYRFDPAAAWATWSTQMRAMPDLRAPVVPTTEIDGAAVGFREWVATAETIH